MAYGRNFGSYANGGDVALASQIVQLTREREQRNWAERQQEQMRRQQVKDANAQAFYEAGQRPRENSPAFLATSDGRTGHIEDGAFIPSQADALADRNRQLMEDYRMQGVQTRAAQKERENLQNVALCGMITSAQQNGGFVDPSMLGMVNQQLGDGTVKCIGGDTDGRGNLRIYGETGNGVRGVMLTLSRKQQAALMGKTPGIEGADAFVEKYVTDQIANGVPYADVMKELGLDAGKMKSGASAAMRGERSSGGRASAQEKFDKDYIEYLDNMYDSLSGKANDASLTDEQKKKLGDRLSRIDEMRTAYLGNYASRFPTAKEREDEFTRLTKEREDEIKKIEEEKRHIRAELNKQAFNAAFQNGRLAGSGNWRGADGEEVLKYNGRRYAVGEAVDLGNGVMATWLGGGIEPENFELVVETEAPAPAPESTGGNDAKADMATLPPKRDKPRRKPAPSVTEEAAVVTPKGEAAVAVEEPAKEDEEDNMPRYERWGRNIGDVVMAAVGEVKAKGMDVADAAKYIGNKVADAYMAASDYLTETPKQEREKAERRAGDWARAKELEERNARNAERLAKEKDRTEAQNRERRQARARADVEKATADLVDFNEQMKRIGEEYERKQARKRR